MPTEVHKCIFRGSNSAILSFTALLSGVQLLLGANSSFDTILEGFVNRGEKRKSEVVPLCENGREKSNMVYSNNYLNNKVVSHILATRCNINVCGKTIR